MFQHFSGHSARCSERKEDASQVVERTTVIQQLFGGYLRSQIKCLKCHYTSNTSALVADAGSPLGSKCPNCHPDMPQSLEMRVTVARAT